MAFKTKFPSPGHSQISLIGLHPFFPALFPTILPLMLQSDSLFSMESSGEMACLLVAGLKPEREHPSPPPAFYPCSQTQRGRRHNINDTQNPQLKA